MDTLNSAPNQRVQMFLAPGGEWVCSSKFTNTRLNITLRYVVIAMTVGASRLYLGLVNSAAFHSPPEGAVRGKEWPIATRVGSHSPSNLSRLEEGEGKA
jgi:hypothetical protein